VRLKIAPGFDLVAALGDSRLATADPDSVPAGQYARAALTQQKRVRVVDVFPADTHPPIVYPVALTAGARAQAQRFTAFLSSAAARAIFVRQGFVVLTPQGTAP
jgi:molybdate transport system substrate-binding protein